MKITPLQQYLIMGVLILGGILFGFYQYLWKPVNVEIVTLTSTRDQKKKDLEEAKRIVARYAEFKKQAATVQRELEWYEVRIPKKLSMTQFVEALNTLQRRTGVVFTQMTFQAAKAGASYMELPADVRFATDYQGLLNFLYRLSVAESFLIANNLSIMANTADDERPINVTMTVKGVMAK